jgi:2-methylcitrate dehydratase PrpD
MMSVAVTDLVAEFVTSVRFEDLPEVVVRRAIDAITDCVGVALAGTREPLASCLLSVVAHDAKGTAAADLIGSRRKAGWADAALYNGTVAHAIDYDDTSHPAYTHPSCVLVPVLLSLGKYAGCRGRDLIVAYVVGFEVQGKLGRALNMSHYARGWHATGTFGALAAAAAGAKLLRLGIKETKMALGIAASAACGLRANFGTMTKPLHAGYAARNGVLAALLAERGFTAVEDVLENRLGYLYVFAGGDPPRLEVFSDLGRPFEIATEFGIALKPYPSCGATHTAVEAAIDISKETRGDEIVEVVVGTNELTPSLLVYKNPRTPLEAKFSMEFCVAAALVRGELKRSSFSVGTLDDPMVRKIMQRVTLQVDERVRHSTEFGTVVTVRCGSGRVVERVVELAKGKPGRWMSREELLTKFLDCAQEVLNEEKARLAFRALQGLESATSIDDIIKYLTIPSD